MKNILPLPIPSLSISDFPQPDGSPMLDFGIEFTQWFTVLSGENGTGKSTVLRKIKESRPDRTFLYNPKRNSERKAVLQVYEQIEREGRRKTTLAANKLSKAFDDNTFELYSSFPEIVASDFLERLKTSGGDLNPNQIIGSLKKEYGGLVKLVFPSYRIVDWRYQDGAPYFRLRKFNKYVLETQQLSTGEQEILSLVFNTYFFKDSYDILLIDEPEIHLNWALEDRLFQFLKRFALRSKKQIIVTTHSRVIFDESFKDNCVFLYFDSNRRVVVSRDIPESARKEISGDIMKFVVSKEDVKTIFVEDNFHKVVVEQLGNLLSFNKDFNVQIMSGKVAIKSLYGGISQRPVRGIFKNAYFLVDGDREKDPHQADVRYVHLAKYCLESYFLNFRIISNITNKPMNTIKQIVCSAINKEKQKSAKDGQIYLRGTIQPIMLRQKDFDRFDCTSILERTINNLHYTKIEFVSDYLTYLKDKRRLYKFFDKKLIDFFSQ